MLIRRLVATDAAPFQALRLAGLHDSPSAFGSTYAAECATPLAAIESKLAAGTLFGAFEGVELIGIIAVGRDNSPKLRHKAYLRAMVVAPAQRGKGAARQLVDHALAAAAAMDDVRQVTLDVTAGNAPALRLYESFGFREYGREPRAMLVDGVFYDTVLMVREIEPGQLSCEHQGQGVPAV
ncbi:GNAT family N-acetyltransferase [Massilia sp. TSP1-1-2]|uniref:GNAT family N-acetyltransferase n=1 Tax=Massilia sp. TSP1-1-2 TaxID=2804649 RepID=UPI003CEE9D24